MERQQITKTNQGDPQRATSLFAKTTLPSRAPVHPFLKLQRTLGNQVVGRFFQAKLKVNQPGDVYEQEADRVAEEVMSMPEAMSRDISPHSSPAVQRKCAACAGSGEPCPQCAEEEKMMQRKPLAAQITPLIQRQTEEAEEDEEEILQAKEVAGQTPAATPALESHINNVRGGEPLSEFVRAFFEPRFGYDFSQVRVHWDAQAANSAQAVNALAYTVGRDVVFGAGQYAPETLAGQRLLAHELTHVIEQRPVTRPRFLGSRVDVGERADSPIIQRACPSCDEEIRARQRAGENCPRCQARLPREERERVQEETQRIREEREQRRRELRQQRREEEGLQRKEFSTNPRENNPKLDDHVNAVLSQGGQTLPEAIRTFMESHLGHDFGGVRVHTGSQAAETALRVNARAFTMGQDVVFGAGEYAPETIAGRRLLAHELTHVVQQGKSRRIPASVGNNKAAKIQPTSSGPSLQRVGFWEKVTRFFGGGTFSEQELQAYLSFLKVNRRIEDHYDSDNKAREVVNRWKRGDSKYAIIPVDIKILLIKEMLSGFTGDDDERAILDLLHGSTDHDLATILSEISVETLNDALQGEEQDELDALVAERGAGRRGEREQTGRGAETASPEIFSEESVAEAQDRFMENALLGEARAHCIKIIHDFLPGLFAQDPQLQRRVERTLRGLRQEGETYTIDATGEALRRLNLASPGTEIFFSSNSGNHRVEPGALESSAWDTILGMVGDEVGWHIFGMSVFNGYHSVTVFVNNRPDGKKLVYWADQWAIGPGENFYQAEGSVSGLRRYEKEGFDRFISEYTHSRWCRKSTCDNAHWRARLTIWKFYSSQVRRQST